MMTKAQRLLQDNDVKQITIALLALSINEHNNRHIDEIKVDKEETGNVDKDRDEEIEDNKRANEIYSIIQNAQREILESQKDDGTHDDMVKSNVRDTADGSPKGDVHIHNNTNNKTGLTT